MRPAFIKITSRPAISVGIKIGRVAAVLALVLFMAGLAKGQTSIGISRSPDIAVLSGNALTTNATVALNPPTVSTDKIKNIVTFGIIEETQTFIPVNFTVSAKVVIDYGASSSSFQSTPEQTLTISYSKDEGVKYNAKSYFHFSGAAFVKVTLKDLIPATVSGFDLKKVLLLQNEMRVTSYPTLANVQPTSFSLAAHVAKSDTIQAAWGWPATTGHTHTQLEWTWLEEGMQEDYTINGIFNPGLVFKNGATRIDLPGSRIKYNIPVLYGKGKIYARIRPVNFQISGNRIDGAWSAIDSQAVYSHADSLNWQSTTSFAEEGKRKSVVQYYDGSLRNRQTVTKNNVDTTTVVAETFYDEQGRPAIQILPTPTISKVIGYTKNLNKFNLQADNTDPALLFDLQPANSVSRSVPALSEGSGAAKYYSASNPEMNLAANANIPAAAGFPYTVTRYTPDATGRIMAQSGVGAAMQMGGGHETQYFYGSPSQEELDGLFGTEVGIFTHYFKNMVRDANGQMSVSYVDMHGRTIATALAGKEPTGMDSLVTDAVNYPGQSGTVIKRNLLDTATNVVKGNSLEAINSLLVPVRTTYSFEYKLDSTQLQILACGKVRYYDCAYNLEIAIGNDAGDSATLIKRYNNINPLIDDKLSTPIALFKNSSGTVMTGNVIKDEITLNPGSYTIRKTLTLSEATLEKYKQLFIDSAMCKSEQALIDSLYGQMVQSGCTTPQTVPLSGSQTLSMKRTLMLQDMMPYGGQYARESINTTYTSLAAAQSMFNTYNIFSTNTPDFQQKFRKPLNSVGFPGKYRTDDGLIDPSIHPDPATNIYLDAISQSDFVQSFSPSWTKALLPHHPEYQKLLFSEATLVNSYDWIANFSATPTWTAAAASGFLFSPASPLNDPFYSVNNPAPPVQYKTDMEAKITGNYINGLSMWQIAYGDVKCKDIVSPSQQQFCYQDAPKLPTELKFQNLLPAEKDQAWIVFKGHYAATREAQVNAYINTNGDNQHAQSLVDGGYLVHFPLSNKQMAQQFGDSWSWMPDAPGGEPNTSGITGGSTSIQTYASRCESYITRWKQILLQCELLPANTKDTIINQIVAGMVAVCKKGSDASNPYGSSTVAPSSPNDGSPRSFEAVIDAVFANYGISKSYLCNPYTIDFPKSYGQGPVMVQEITTSLDTCNCGRLTQLKVEATAAGKNPAVLFSFNQYLQTTYGDTLSLYLYTVLNANCSLLGKTICTDSVTTVPANYGDLVDCGCSIYKGEDNLYYKACTERKCTEFTAAFALITPQAIPSFLKCGFTQTVKCLDCAQLAAYTREFKRKLPAPFNSGPVFTGTDLSTDQVKQNTLFARFINFRTGFQYNWMDYAQNTGGCNFLDSLASLTNHTNILCRNSVPLTDTAGIFVQDSACHNTRLQAITIGHDLYQQRRDALLGLFEASYRAKAMAARDSFTVTYVNKEYHYTLYYYDQAGSLVKTVPPKGVRPNWSSANLKQVSDARKAGTTKVPAHLLATNYRYNSLAQVVAQNSPDGGTSSFWYDRLGRLAVSQNAQQKLENKYSYTLYDALGRITEVGQKGQTTAMTQTISQDTTALKNWIITNGSIREQLTTTVYDQPYLVSTADPNGVLATGGYVWQKNLRNRVSYTAVKALATDGDNYAATFYTYDIHGNVDTLLQDYNGIAAMQAASNRFKRTTYSYDLISGKVNSVSYQGGQLDAFYHRYYYDAENRLTEVRTSRDSVLWERDAAYAYYKHGPLARTELGQLRVQGADYLYTLQGWLKGVNVGVSDASLTPVTTDCGSGAAPDDLVVMNRTGSTPSLYTARTSISFETGFESGATDAFETDINGNLVACGTSGSNSGSGWEERRPVARDAYNFSLNYYGGDYTPIKNGTVTSYQNVLAGLGANAAPLFNGNIAAMAVNVPKLGAPNVYAYRYDQLNRLTRMDTWKELTAAGFAPDTTSSYRERISYDPNGNILTYLRNGTKENSQPLAMDNLTYNYTAASNKLRQVTDAVGTTSYTEDIETQANPDNYTYDAIGNLKGDAAEGITNITWNVYGKILSLTSKGNLITYSYDAAGNRISKTAGGKTTVYVRDASGNVMSVYEKPSGGTLTQAETHLYGSSRLGIAGTLTTAPASITLASGFGAASISTFTRGEKSFELSNHLGNVLAAVSDKKLQHDSSGYVDYYVADVVSATDYAPFGMGLVGRKWQSAGYRYGFNGKENDNEVKGDGNQQDYGMRISDPRLGRFLSVDPITEDYPSLTPYQFASNSPIKCIDLDGLEGDPVAEFNMWATGVFKDLTSAKRWKEAVRNVNAMVNPLYIASDHISKIARGKDIEGNVIDDYRGRMGAVEDATADAIGFVTLNRLGKVMVASYGTSALEGQMNSANRALQSSKPPLNKPILNAPKEILGRNASSNVLGQNIEISGVSRPANSAAHHIVAGNDSRAAISRSILNREGIDINESANGVFLPKNTKYANPPAATHSTLHTDKYYQELNRRLLGAKSGSVKQELTQIKKELLNGTFPQ